MRLVSKVAGGVRSSLRAASRRSMSNKSGKDSSTKKVNVGAAAVGKTRADPKVADKAMQTKAARESASGGGGSGAMSVVAVGAVIGAGYTAYKLTADPSFATSLRSMGLGSVVEGIGKVVPLAKEMPKAAPKTSTKKATTATITNEKRESTKTTTDEAGESASTAKTEAGSEENTQPVAATASAAAEGEKNEMVKEENAESKTSDEIRSETQEAAIAAEIASEDAQQRAGETVQAALDVAEQDAAVVAEEKPSPSEMERLREEVRDIERTVTEKQSDVRRDTVKQLRVREAVLRGELEDMLARDLSELNIEDLRRRVVQLVMELQERNKTEAAQLIAVLENAEKHASDKSVDALREQSEKYEDLIRASLRQQEVKLQDDYAERLGEYIAESNARMQQVADELNEANKQNLDTKLSLARAEHEAEIAAVSAEEQAGAFGRANAVQAARVATVEDLRLKLQALDKVFQVNAEYLSNSHQIHLVSTALLALYNSLSGNGRSTSLSDATASLRVAARSDPVITAALASLPKAAMAGVPTLSELEARFAVAREESRKALYTPDGSGLVGHALGSFTAGILTVAPDGSGTEGEGTEACLARAHEYIAAGNVRSALMEVGRVEGDAAAVMVDWVEAARMRLLVEQAVNMIGAHVTTLVATLS